MSKSTTAYFNVSKCHSTKDILHCTHTRTMSDGKYKTVFTQVQIEISINIIEKRILLHQMAQGMNHGSQYNVLHPLGDHSTEQQIHFKTSCGEERKDLLNRNSNLSGNTYKQYKMMSPKTRCNRCQSDTQLQQLLVFSQCCLARQDQVFWSYTTTKAALQQNLALVTEEKYTFFLNY